MCLQKLIKITPLLRKNSTIFPQQVFLEGQKPKSLGSGSCLHSSEELLSGKFLCWHRGRESLGEELPGMWRRCP